MYGFFKELEQRKLEKEQRSEYGQQSPGATTSAASAATAAGGEKAIEVDEVFGQKGDGQSGGLPPSMSSNRNPADNLDEWFVKAPVPQKSMPSSSIDNQGTDRKQMRDQPKLMMPLDQGNQVQLQQKRVGLPQQQGPERKVEDRLPPITTLVQGTNGQKTANSYPIQSTSTVYKPPLMNQGSVGNLMGDQQPLLSPVQLHYSLPLTNTPITNMGNMTVHTSPIQSSPGVYHSPPLFRTDMCIDDKATVEEMIEQQKPWCDVDWMTVGSAQAQDQVSLVEMGSQKRSRNESVSSTSTTKSQKKSKQATDFPVDLKKRVQELEQERYSNHRQIEFLQNTVSHLQRVLNAQTSANSSGPSSSPASHVASPVNGPPINFEHAKKIFSAWTAMKPEVEKTGNFDLSKLLFDPAGSQNLPQPVYGVFSGCNLYRYVHDWDRQDEAVKQKFNNDAKQYMILQKELKEMGLIKPMTAEMLRKEAKSKASTSGEATSSQK